MRFTILLILTVLLSGCKNESAVGIIGDSAKESINVIVANKPECKDVGLACNSQIDSVVASCNLQKESIDKDRIRWQWAFWGLLSIIAVYFGKRVLK